MGSPYNPLFQEMMEQEMIDTFMRDARIYFGLDRQWLDDPRPCAPAPGQAEAADSLQRQTTREE
jgi:hypothetical protein